MYGDLSNIYYHGLDNYHLSEPNFIVIKAYFLKKKRKIMSLRGRNNLSDCTHFFVTTTVVDFLRVFKDENVCKLLVSNINHYKRKYNFIILGYVIMPSHFHWIIEVNKKFGTISDIMRDIKKYSAWDIMEYLLKTNHNYNNEFKESAKGYMEQKRKFWMPVLTMR
jgi:REP element-mobilizing transposase RayT